MASEVKKSSKALENSKGIKLENVKYTYPSGSIVAFDCFEVRNNEKVFLAGETGCGKSTLLRILNGIIPEMYGGKLEGYISVYGNLGNNKDVFLVTQHPEEQIIMDTVFDEMAFTFVQTNKSYDELYEMIYRISNIFADEFRIDKMLNKKMLELSDGEKELVTLCCALALDNKCIALDEPLAHLHPKIAKRIVKYILKSRKNVILSEHRMEFSEEFDRTVELDISFKSEFKSEFNKNTNKRKSNNKTKEIIESIMEIKSRMDFKSEIALNIRDLSVFKNNKKILDCINFKVHEGELMALTGINGSGKTTLLRCIAGLEKYNGSIDVKGDVKLAYQYPSYNFSKNKVKQEAEIRYLKLLGLENLTERNPHSLSGGEKRLLSVAKAMSGDIILLDEPTAGLDRFKRLKLIKELIYEARQNCKVVLISTHDTEVASLCDSFVELTI